MVSRNFHLPHENREYVETDYIPGTSFSFFFSSDQISEYMLTLHTFIVLYLWELSQLPEEKRKENLRDRPTALKTKMKTRVQDTRPVSQAHLDLSTAEIPRKMKIMVSAMLARVFIVYFTVVRDFWEMLASTYLLAPMPQKVILKRERDR